MLLYRRLKVRGHAAHILRPMFLEAYRKLTSNAHQHTHTPTRDAPAALTNPGPSTQDSNQRQLYLHLEYHPNNIPRRTVRQLYKKHCGHFTRELNLDCMIVAYYSRPNSIRDYVSHTKLHQEPGKEASKCMGEYPQGLHP